MQYYVLGPNGEKYGPADLPTLNGWIQEGRVLPTTVLENVSTGVQAPANMISGLVFAVRAGDLPPGAPPTLRPTMAPAGPTRSAAGGKEWKNVWISIGLGVAAIVCVFFIGIGGLILGLPSIRAGWSAIRDDENYVGVVGLLLGIAALVLWIVVRFVRF